MATKKKYLLLQWRVVYKDTITQAIKDTGIQKLMTYIRDKAAVTPTSKTLDYEVFKNEVDNLSYILRVYSSKKIAAPPAPEIDTTSKTTSGKSVMRAAATLKKEGTIPPVGPPSTPPPGIATIESD